MYIKSYKPCCHCGNDIITSRLKVHESKCIEMQLKRNKPKKKAGHPKGQPAWNKGLSKETDDRVKKNSESVAKTLRQKVLDGTFIPSIPGEKARQATSERQSLFNSGGKSKWYIVANQKVQGTYEKQFAECLEAESIVWTKVKTHNHIFKYEKDGKLRSYAPDFFLPELNLYVEIKGFWWGNDEEKMNIIKTTHQDKNVIVLFGKQKLDSICENIKEKLPLEPVWSW